MSRQFEWDRAIGNDPVGGDETTVLYLKHLWKRFGCRLDLHWIVRKDEVNCFHTHPAWAIRLILMGGYVEEIATSRSNHIGRFRRWEPGMWGVVRPQFCHRIHRVLHTAGSYSLWLRGPIVANIWIGGFQRDTGLLKMEELSHVKEE